MQNTNSENPKVEKAFQEEVCQRLSEQFNVPLQLEKAIPIGNPPKSHRFDCASADSSIVVECKCYTWTDSGNIPSAKMMGLNEAVFYMSYLPAETRKIIAMKKAQFSGRRETFAEYYVRINGHLLSGIEILEVSPEEIRLVHSSQT